LPTSLPPELRALAALPSTVAELKQLRASLHEWALARSLTDASVFAFD
jgi:hypothetical protein